MQEWSIETHAQAAQRAVAEQIEGMTLFSLSDSASTSDPSDDIPHSCNSQYAPGCQNCSECAVARSSNQGSCASCMSCETHTVQAKSWRLTYRSGRATRSPSRRQQSSGLRRAELPNLPSTGYASLSLACSWTSTPPQTAMDSSQAVSVSCTLRAVRWHQASAPMGVA